MMRRFYFGLVCGLAIWTFGCDGCDDDVESTAGEDTQPSVEPQVAVGNGWACVIDEQGTLDCDGELSEEFASPPEGRFRTVSVSSTHACALDVDGHSHCWDRIGQLGIPETDREFVDTSVGDLEVPPKDKVFRDVSVADGITCAALDEGGIQCWGQGADWQDWDAIDETFDEVVTTPGHACALETGGGIQCWSPLPGGSGEPIERLQKHGPFEAIDKPDHDPHLFGAALMANGAVTHWPVGEMPPYLDSLPRREGDYRQVATGHHFQCVLDTEGAVECYTCVMTNGEAVCELPVDNYLDDPPAGPFEFLSAGWSDVCAVDANSDVVCWGPSTDGEPGTPSDLRPLEDPDGHVVASGHLEYNPTLV